MKLLVHDGFGVWCTARRLNAGGLVWPKWVDGNAGAITLTQAQFDALVDGDALRLGFEDLAAGPIAFDVFENSDAPPRTLEIRESGLSEHFELLLAFAADDSPVGSELEGRYRCADLDADATIDLQDGKIRMRVFGAWGTSISMLTAYSNDVLGWQIQSAELPLRGVMTLERVGGKLTAFKMDTLRARHLRFERVEERAH